MSGGKVSNLVRCRVVFHARRFVTWINPSGHLLGLGLPNLLLLVGQPPEKEGENSELKWHPIQVAMQRVPVGQEAGYDCQGA